MWRDFLNLRTGAGGNENHGELVLVTDLENEALLVQSGTRLKVDGVVCGIQRVSPLVLTEQLIIRAMQVQ